MADKKVKDETPIIFSGIQAKHIIRVASDDLSGNAMIYLNDLVSGIVAAASGGGDIKSDGSVDFTAAQTWDDGGGNTIVVSPIQITINDGVNTSLMNAAQVFVTDGVTSVSLDPAGASGLQVSSGSSNVFVSSTGVSVGDGSNLIALNTTTGISITDGSTLISMEYNGYLTVSSGIYSPVISDVGSVQFILIGATGVGSDNIRFSITNPLHINDPATGGYSLPIGDGTSGQVLTTSGTGVVGWQDIPASLLADGTVVGATGVEQVFTNGLVAPYVKPTSGSSMAGISMSGVVTQIGDWGGGGNGTSIYMDDTAKQMAFSAADGIGINTAATASALLSIGQGSETKAQMWFNTDGIIPPTMSPGMMGFDKDNIAFYFADAEGLRIILKPVGGWTTPSGSTAQAGYDADWNGTISALYNDAEIIEMRDQLVLVQKNLAALIIHMAENMLILRP